MKKSKKSKQRYLTVHVRPSDKLVDTIVVSIPREFYSQEAIPEVVKIAIETAQGRDSGNGH